MTELSDSIDVDVAADLVWNILANRFDRIGQWATAIPASAPAATATALIDVGAPIPARVCDTGIRPIPQVTETIIAFDPGARTLTYQATAGMPNFVTAARNTWTVTELDLQRCRVCYDAELSTQGLIGLIARPLMLARVARDGRHLLTDLKHYAETGRPSPRKLARTRTATANP